MIHFLGHKNTFNHVRTYLMQKQAREKSLKMLTEKQKTIET